MSSSSSSRPRFELGFCNRMWAKQSNAEIEEPIATFHIQLENWHALPLPNNNSANFVSSSAASVFVTRMSCFLSLNSSCLTIYRMLSHISVDGSLIEELNAAISYFSFKRVEEVMSRGLNGLEISVHVKVHLQLEEDAAAAVLASPTPTPRLVPVGFNSTVAAAHSSRSSAEIDALVESFRAQRWDAKTACTICLDDLGDYDETKKVSLLPCLHLFHGRCMKRWLQAHDSCPLCRFKI